MSLERRVTKLTSILDVAKAMTAERDLDTLLSIIVEEAKRVVDADRCTIFVRDRATDELWSRVAHGLTTREIRLDAGAGIAGHVARHDVVLNITDPYADERFNKEVDAVTGYRTEAILCVPMRGPRGEVVGVLQALNPVGRDEPFGDDDAELLLALGGQAAAAIQNAFLYDEIDRLFEGLVRASIVAIESRDPVTSGHSERVAAMTVGLAEVVNETTDGPWGHSFFTTRELRELNYACLLHDMGKVGVREHVLTKPEKLLPEQKARIRGRLDVARAGIRRDHYRRLYELAGAGASRGAAERDALRAAAERRLEEALAEVDEIEALVARASLPIPLDDELQAALERFATRELPGVDGRSRVLTDEEVELLRIPRGSLSDDERREIESHVTHSYNFLVQIPWTDDLDRIPELAWGHHEKLDGTGYPQGLTSDEIVLGTRMMTIADIYDALTAMDRPYKKALPHERAVSILQSEAERGAIDADLLALFVDHDVPRRVGVETLRDE